MPTRLYPQISDVASPDDEASPSLTITSSCPQPGSASPKPRMRIAVAQWLAELNAAPELLRELMAAANIVRTEQFPPLATVTKTHVDTAAAAHYLNRRPQTLRGWHCHGDFIDGLRPLVINSRLAWPVAGIKKIMGA